MFNASRFPQIQRFGKNPRISAPLPDSRKKGQPTVIVNDVASRRAKASVADAEGSIKVAVLPQTKSPALYRAIHTKTNKLKMISKEASQITLILPWSE
ncbi:hypothetical protein V6N11_075482 [Hibiscus sabdariffa]|uniref:Uncharacterized protein n=1 Tax=Hibiscus sabdariffa TaxID=183260 RepID=A0ABR2R6M5_9ROSI